MKIIKNPRIKTQRDLTGLVVGSLTVVATSDQRSGDSVMWQCTCNCGDYFCVKSIYVSSATLVKGTCTTCRKHRSKKAIAVRRYYWMTSEGARRRDYSFNLTLPEFHMLIRQPCHYCGDKTDIRQIYNGNGNTLFCRLLANGIDRVDNIQGYCIENCVSCCARCNRAKDTMSSIEYITLCQRVTKLHSM